MRIVLSFVAVVAILLSTPAAAQQVERQIDLTALGWGNISAYPVETDGNPVTEEWAIRSNETNAWRVVSLRASLCAGPWFAVASPLPGGVPLAEVVSIGGLSKLRVTAAFMPASLFNIVGLTTPQC